MSLTVIHTGKSVLASDRYVTVIIKQCWTKESVKQNKRKTNGNLTSIPEYFGHSFQTNTNYIFQKETKRVTGEQNI